MNTPIEARILLTQLLTQLREALRPDRVVIDLLDALDRFETAKTYIARRELLTSSEIKSYADAADAILYGTETEAEQIERASQPVSVPADSWSTPEAHAAVEGEETAWAQALDADLEPLTLTDAELESQLHSLTTADLHRLLRAADGVVAQRESAAVALARRADPRCPAATNLIQFPIHH